MVLCNEKLEMYNRVTTWHTEQVAYLLKRLQAFKKLMVLCG